MTSVINTFQNHLQKLHIDLLFVYSSLRTYYSLHGYSLEIWVNRKYMIYCKVFNTCDWYILCKIDKQGVRISLCVRNNNQQTAGFDPIFYKPSICQHQCPFSTLERFANNCKLSKVNITNMKNAIGWDSLNGLIINKVLIFTWSAVVMM